MASQFLDNLKKAVDTGEFNSEAAKRINEIYEQANIAISNPLSKSQMEKFEENLKLESVSEEEAIALNSQYDEKMEELKREDEKNKQIAELINIADTQLSTLIDIENMINESIDDMFSYIDELEIKFEKEFESENPIFGQLYLKIEQLKLK